MCQVLCLLLAGGAVVVVGDDLFWSNGECRAQD